MVAKDIVKKAFSEAENELKEKQVEEVKQIVKKTLEKLDKLKEKKKDLDEQIKVLKMDIDDLKEGKLDRIVERQEKDPDAKKTSVVIIEKVIIKERETPNYWYWPYHIRWNTPFYNDNVVYCDNTADNTLTFSSGTTTTNLSCTTSNALTYDGQKFSNGVEFEMPQINCSVAKDSVIGTYNVNGKTIHLR